MWQTMILLLGVLFTAAGITLVYDARIITKKVFSFGDQNEAALGLKMIGFILCMIGAFVIILNK